MTILRLLYAKEAFRERQMAIERDCVIDVQFETHV
jgi:hypothetical protein